MSELIQVPLLDLKPQYAALRDEIAKAMQDVIESQYFILGPEVAALEEEIAHYCGTRFAVGCASGSDALLLALMAHGIGEGDEVLCPSYTFFATASAITRLGGIPVFVDIDPVTYNLDLEALRSAAKRCTRLKAILPVHLYGQAVDLEGVLALANELGVPVIEDAAQAIGAKDAQGNRVGSRGSIGCFSFFPTKNLGGFGDGGIVTTQDEALAEQLSMLRMHGMQPKYFHPTIGVNSRLDALQAAVLRVKLRHLDEWNKTRQENANVYDRGFADAGAETSATPLGGSGLPIRTPLKREASATHIYNQYILRVPASKRDALRAHLTSQGIGSEIYYPVPLHLQECFSNLGYKSGDLPESETAAKETLALPIFAELTNEQLDHVVQSTVDFFK